MKPANGPAARIGLAIALCALLRFPESPRAQAAASLGLATFSTGTWASYGTLDGFAPRQYTDGVDRYEFNKILAMGFYGKALGRPFFFALPLQWTSKRMSARGGEEAGRSDRVAFGDGEFHLGWKIRAVEARAGLIFPAGYDRDDGNPWIGPGNFQATLGAAVNPDIARYSRRWVLSAEGKWAYALDDAIAKSGSWAFYPGGKASFRPTEKWKAGLECLGYWKSTYWSRAASFGQSLLGKPGPPAQWNAGLVPTLFGERYYTSHLALGLKAGHSLWGYRDAASYHASLYLLYFP